MPITSDIVALSAIERARVQKQAAEHLYHNKIARYLTKGTRVTYDSGSNLIEVVVLGASDDRVRVINERTGKTYDIYAYRITDISRKWKIQ